MRKSDAVSCLVSMLAPVPCTSGPPAQLPKLVHATPSRRTPLTPSLRAGPAKHVRRPVGPPVVGTQRLLRDGRRARSRQPFSHGYGFALFFSWAWQDGLLDVPSPLLFSLPAY